MSASDPLGSSFFRYRKRKQISVDGHTPGLEYQKRHRGDAHAPPTGHSLQNNRGGDYLGGQDSTEYDPGRSFYSSVGPHYHGPPSWDGLPIEPTPPLRVAPGTLPPDEPAEDHLAWFRAMIDPAHRSPPTIGDIWRRVLAQAEYNRSVAIGNILAEARGGYSTAPPPGCLDTPGPDAAYSEMGEISFYSGEVEDLAEPLLGDATLSTEEAPGPRLDDLVESAFESGTFSQPALEDLINEAWQQLDQAMMNDPMQMPDPYDQFPPGPPGMPTDPLGPMGPGM
jgi:hypothetical protein